MQSFCASPFFVRYPSRTRACPRKTTAGIEQARTANGLEQSVTVLSNAHSPFFEIALVLVRLDHLARRIENPNHGIMRSAVLAGVADCIAGGVRSVIPEPPNGNASEIKSTPRLSLRGRTSYEWGRAVTPRLSLFFDAWSRT